MNFGWTRFRSSRSFNLNLLIVAVKGKPRLFAGCTDRAGEGTKQPGSVRRAVVVNRGARVID